MDSGAFNSTADRILRVLLLEEGAEGPDQRLVASFAQVREDGKRIPL